MSSSKFRGSLSSKSRQKAFKLSTGDGPLAASLDFGGSTSLSVTLLDVSGQTIATVTGQAVLELRATVPAGTKQIVVAGDGTKTTFRLIVTYATP